MSEKFERWEPWPNSYSEGAYQRSLLRDTTSEPTQSPGGALSEVSRSDSADDDHSKAVAAHETRQAPCPDHHFRAWGYCPYCGEKLSREGAGL